MKKYISIIVVFLFILLTFFISRNNITEYNKNFFYMDTIITVKINIKNNINKDKIFDGIDKIYSKYQKLTNYYDNNSDIYYINNNDSKDEELTIDEDLYKILELSNTWKEKSNNKFNINIGKVLEVWNKYRDNNLGIPSMDDLNNAYNSINELVLLGNNKIKNTHPSIDLGAISKGYASEEVEKYLKDNNITDFIINAGGNVIVGTPSKKDKFSIGIKNPEEKNDIYKTIYGKDISIVTSGSYERFYEYNNVRYSHIIDPDTLYPANNFLSVTVISKSSSIADILSTTLFILPLEDGLNLVESMPDTEAIYYISKDNIITSKGFKDYE